MPKTKYVDFKAVKAAVSIVQILDHYGLTERFKRSGDSLSGPCPLHNGDNPTQFRVSISKNCWNCFSECKHGGNIIDFVARKENCTIRQAALHIAEWFNLLMEEPSDDSTNQPRQWRERSAEPPARKRMFYSPAVAESGTGAECPQQAARFPTQRPRPLTSLPHRTRSSASHRYSFRSGRERESQLAQGSVGNPARDAGREIIGYAGRWAADNIRKSVATYKFIGQGERHTYSLHRALAGCADCPLLVTGSPFDVFHLWQCGFESAVALFTYEIFDLAIHQLAHHCPQRRFVVLCDETERGQNLRLQLTARLARFVSVRAPEFRELERIAA